MEWCCCWEVGSEICWVKGTFRKCSEDVWVVAIWREYLCVGRLGRRSVIVIGREN
jgi:hypothetical protein